MFNIVLPVMCLGMLFIVAPAFGIIVVSACSIAVTLVLIQNRFGRRTK